MVIAAEVIPGASHGAVIADADGTCIKPLGTELELFQGPGGASICPEKAAALDGATTLHIPRSGTKLPLQAPC